MLWFARLVRLFGHSARCRCDSRPLFCAQTIIRRADGLVDRTWREGCRCAVRGPMRLPHMRRWLQPPGNRPTLIATYWAKVVVHCERRWQPSRNVGSRPRSMPHVPTTFSPYLDITWGQGSWRSQQPWYMRLDPLSGRQACLDGILGSGSAKKSQAHRSVRALSRQASHRHPRDLPAAVARRAR